MVTEPSYFYKLTQGKKDRWIKDKFSQSKVLGPAKSVIFIMLMFENTISSKFNFRYPERKNILLNI